MNIDKLFSDKEYLEQEIIFFTSKKHLRKIANNPELVQSHLKKARHNLEFYKLNKEHHQFNDGKTGILFLGVEHDIDKILNERYSNITARRFHRDPAYLIPLLESIAINK